MKRSRFVFVLFFMSILLTTIIIVTGVIYLRWESRERTVITVDSQGRTFIDGRELNRALLEDRLREAVELRGLRVAYLSADEELELKEIMAVVGVIKNAGVDAVGMDYIYSGEKRAR